MFQGGSLNINGGSATSTTVSSGGFLRAVGAGVGDVVALPVVHHLRESGGPIERFNLSMLVRTSIGAREAQVATVLQALLDQARWQPKWVLREGVHEVTAEDARVLFDFVAELKK